MLASLPLNTKLALASMWSKKIRSILTIVGVMIGVFAITTLLGVGQGVKNAVTDQVEAIGTNVIFVVPGKLVSGSGGFNPSATIGASTLTDADLTTIQKLPDVVASSPISLASGVIKVDGTETSGLLILGTSHENDEVRSVTETQGRFIEPADESAKAKVAVLGSSAATKLFPQGGEIVGKDFTFRNVTFKVIGVIKQTTSSVLGTFNGPSFDDAVYFPFSTLADVTGSSQIFRIGAKARDANRVIPVKESIQRALKSNHSGEEDFSVLTQDDFLKIFNQILGVLTTMVSAIAGISLLVGGIGIMNIMLVSVTERTKEIGLRKAIGASAGDIFIQFLFESILLGLFGGAMGIAASVVARRIIEAKASLTIVLTPTSVLLAVGFAVVVGVIFGVAPALRAARLSPIEALKYE